MAWCHFFQLYISYAVYLCSCHGWGGGENKTKVENSKALRGVITTITPESHDPNWTNGFSAPRLGGTVRMSVQQKLFIYIIIDDTHLQYYYRTSGDNQSQPVSKES